MYENKNGYVDHQDRQTIHMHNFHIYGIYSENFSRLILAYVSLVIGHHFIGPNGTTRPRWNSNIIYCKNEAVIL